LAFPISLDATGAKVDQKLSEVIQSARNVTVQVDGWSDINRASLVNIALYADRPIFLKSINPGVQRHDAKYVAQTILDVINNKCSDEGVDRQKFRSVVTDQPSVMQAAWDIVSKNAPWVHCYGCAAHVLNLLASDLRKLVSDTLRDDGITQPVLLRISGSYYIKADHTAILITDCNCFAKAAKFLFACFFCTLCKVPTSAGQLLLFHRKPYKSPRFLMQTLRVFPHVGLLT